MGSTVSRDRIGDRNARVSVHDNAIFRLATLAISFSTWTLITPPLPSSFSARSDLAESADAIYSNTLLSKKLPGIRLFAVELEIGREPAAEGSQPVQQLCPPGLARHSKLTPVGDVDFDFIALLQLQRFDHSCREPHCQAVAPFRNLHMTSDDIQVIKCISAPPEINTLSILPQGARGRRTRKLKAPRRVPSARPGLAPTAARRACRRV